MNAQEEWKSLYRKSRSAKAMRAYAYGHNLRVAARACCREAALERRCEAQQRTIQAQAQRIAYLEQYQHDPRVPIEIRDPRWSNDGT